MAKFPVKKYAALEMNRARYLAQGNVVSQTPLAAEFTEENPCENGMWVCANKANGEIRTLKEEGEMVGIVYTTEKEWGRYEYGLNLHHDVALSQITCTIHFKCRILLYRKLSHI